MTTPTTQSECPDGYGRRLAAKCVNGPETESIIEGAWGDGYIAGRRSALSTLPPVAGAGEPVARDGRERLLNLLDHVASWNCTCEYDVGAFPCESCAAHAGAKWLRATRRGETEGA